jgi:septal ring factor EnvC (AmiA/AmiB activator)
MVQHRRLQEKVEAGLLKQGGAAAEKLQKTISELKARQDAYDHDVAQLMEEDESIDQEIAATEKAITENATTIQELNARLVAITEAQKDEHGVAVVKVGGNLFSGTRSPVRTVHWFFRKISNGFPLSKRTNRTMKG